MCFISWFWNITCRGYGFYFHDELVFWWFIRKYSRAAITELNFFSISFSPVSSGLPIPWEKNCTSPFDLLFDTLPCKYLSDWSFPFLSVCFKCPVMEGNSWEHKYGKNWYFFDFAIWISWLNKASYKLKPNQILLLPKNTTKKPSSVEFS